MSAEQINIEHFFRLLYELTFGAYIRVNGGTADFSTFSALLAQLWFWVIIIGYLLSVLGFFVIIYVTMKLFELRAREKEHYETLIVTPESAHAPSPRWKHILALIEGESESGWREAITEADIMLDETLSRRGYAGDGVGEKLKRVDASELASVQDAWEAHKVRNQIAHEGSAFQLSQSFAERTIQRYETVFREWGVI